MDRNSLQRAILLLGPTGSGKTPLGDELERSGIWGHACAHFDFGRGLRRTAAAKSRPAGLTHTDMAVIVRSLETGALLEDEQFHIALSLLVAFARESRIACDGFLVLNGLPRHVGQACGLTPVVRVELVVYLECTPQTVFERIQRNSGGDRSDRTDDSVEAVARKLVTFRERTLPLLGFYAEQGARIERVTVAADTQSADLRVCLEQGDVP